LTRRLAGAGCTLLTADRRALDLRRQAAVEDWMAANRPDAVFLAAATVGGILANSTRPATFLYDNLAIETNVVHAAHGVGVKKLLLLGSACIYPRLAPQPIPESALLTGPLEPTNEAYAIAKIAGIRLCQAYRREHGRDFIAAQPNNLYGPGDNFDLETSHVIPALMAKAHRAKVSGAGSFPVWGSGRPLREFLYVEDLADALVFLMERYSDFEHVNIGSGEEISIRDLAAAIARTVGFQGSVVLDATKPDGMPRKLLDVSRLAAMGWRSTTDLATGLRRTYDWYLGHHAQR
jgi:GDP-L-fucose synthase